MHITSTQMNITITASEIIYNNKLHIIQVLSAYQCMKNAYHFQKTTEYHIQMENAYHFQTTENHIHGQLVCS